MYSVKVMVCCGLWYGDIIVINDLIEETFLEALLSLGVEIPRYHYQLCLDAWPYKSYDLTQKVKDFQLRTFI